jgi:hypothetical protein
MYGLKAGRIAVCRLHRAPETFADQATIINALDCAGNRAIARNPGRILANRGNPGQIRLSRDKSGQIGS